MLDPLWTRQAQEMPDEKWQTASYRQLLEAVDEWDEAPLRTLLGALLEEMRGTRHRYLESPVEPEQLTRETVACHAPLREGLDLWVEGLQTMLERKAWEEGMEMIEQGCRLLAVAREMSQS